MSEKKRKKDTVEVLEDGRKLIDRPTGLPDYYIPSGDSDMDGKCPNCGEVGLWKYHGSKIWEVICTNRDCRVSKFDIWVKERDRDDE